MNRIFRTESKIEPPVFLVCCTVFLVMLLLSMLTPFGHDDYSYSFSFYDNTRIRTISQIIPSMAVHRQLLNGRLFSHALVQLFLMLPKAVFNICNALNSALLCFLLSCYLQADSKKKAFALSCGAMALWVFSPAFGENCLWLDGAINYAWGYSFFLLFLWPFVADYLVIRFRKPTAVSISLRVLLAFVVGAYSENASLVILFISGCLGILIWKRDRHISCQHCLYLAAGIGGWIFLMSAPATANRGAVLNASVIGNNIASIVTETKSYLLNLLLIIVLLYVIVSHYGGRKQVRILSGLFVLGSLASLCSFAFARYFILRHFCCTVFLLVFSFVILLNEALLLGKKLLGKMLAGCLAVLFAFQFSLGLLDIVVCYHKAQLREQAILSAIAAGERSVTVENCIPLTRYALRFQFSETDAKEWPNHAVASYYGIDEIYGRDPE